jgi:hypothetical protein
VDFRVKRIYKTMLTRRYRSLMPASFWRQNDVNMSKYEVDILKTRVK